MFGYVRMYKPELKVREYEQYRGVYCSLCKQCGNRYGTGLRLTLSYDMTFLALLYMALKPDCVGFSQSRCSYNPLKTCLCCDQTEALAFAADVGALLSYYRCLDSMRDETFLGSFKERVFYPFARRYHRKASRMQPAIDREIAAMMDAQQRLETAQTASIDAAAEPFALLMQCLCRDLSDEEKQREVLSRFGYCLGRYVYLADAADDMQEDAKRHRYNPFVVNRNLSFEDADAVASCRQYALDVLRNCQAECIAAYHLLEIHRFDGILKNVLEQGITATLSQLGNDKRKRKRRSAA